MGDGTILIDVDGVSKSFGDLRAVDQVSFQVAEGQIFGIAGPNGSGKSTLFNIVTGIPFRPDSGKVRFAGREIQGLRGHEIAQAGLARTFQRETSFDSLSVFENALLGVTYGLGQRGAAARRDAVAEALAFTGFSDADFDLPAAALSVYQRKCLMLASALAMQPRMLLLDEPASSLTRPEIETTITLIRQIAARGVTILLIEHVLALLLTLSEHLLVLNQGQILAEGTPDEVVKNPLVIEAYLGRRKQAAA
ncbi:ABC transporter ATP-binding protein [Marinibaculum pumilum]|uniref:ABC transporter ATP-binding protein n=1 Tax=Marinibaculum pumilum TaxID=1766165 RepID=A0ABV7KUJ9_9PROT